jgi:hypothetical protein
MFGNNSDDSINETAERLRHNVYNLPITSMVMAGLLGAGAVALMSVCKVFSHRKGSAQAHYR